MHTQNVYTHCVRWPSSLCTRCTRQLGTWGHCLAQLSSLAHLGSSLMPAAPVNKIHWTIYLKYIYNAQISSEPHNCVHTLQNCREAHGVFCTWRKCITSCNCIYALNIVFCHTISNNIIDLYTSAFPACLHSVHASLRPLTFFLFLRFVYSPNSWTDFHAQ